MRFSYKCDGSDGLVLIDKKFLGEIDQELLAQLDIYLDRYGKTELVYDFPNENWEEIRRRETKRLIDFCNSGKMVIFLYDKDVENCEIAVGTDVSKDMRTCIEVESGKVLLVNASELIQCLAYPELEMEVNLEIDNIEKGIYSVRYDGIKDIKLAKETALITEMHNAIEL